MTALHTLGHSFPYYILCITSILLVIGQLAALIQAIRHKRRALITVTAVFNLLLGLFLFVALMDYAMSMISSPEDLKKFLPFQWALYDVPWLVYTALEVISAAVLAVHIAYHIHCGRTQITPDAVRMAMDRLPEGISISTADGTVLLSNLKMNDICRAMTGAGLINANRFMESVEESGEEQNGSYFVKLPDGEVRLITRRTLTDDGVSYDQLTAADMTERYRIIEELRAKNEHLLDIRRRMKALTDLSGDMFVAQEEAAARAALHNQLGQVLLMGSRYLEHPDNTDAGMVYLTTRQMNSFLLGESGDQPSVEKNDEIRMAIAMAGSIGVAVELCGDPPSSDSLNELLARVIQECAANTVKHAEGDRLTVEITNGEDGATVIAYNNGKPPKGPVAESGGLLSLRRDIEAAGGTMTVLSSPAFKLTITLP